MNPHIFIVIFAPFITWGFSYILARATNFNQLK